GEAITSDGDRVHRLRRAGGARCRREGGRDDSTIPPSSRPFTHSPSPSPSRPQPVPSSSAPPKICPSLSLPDNCPRLLPLRRPPRSRPRYLHGSHPRLLPMPRTDLETASKRGIVCLRFCLGLLSFLMARISFLVLKRFASEMVSRG
ncbi:unnamed protein product, partial [Musa acuminata subsp. burmannicoides]